MPNGLNLESNSSPFQNLKTLLLPKINSFLASRTLSDKSWVKAVSSQYFLVNLACCLNLTKDRSFWSLMDCCLESFTPQFSGGYKLNERNILIIPEENKKLIDCMKKEDENEPYKYHDDLKASKIDKPDIIYKNYLYGLMIYISGVSITNQILKNIFHYCLKELLNVTSLDRNEHGWYHYRLPWITARILTSIYLILEKDCFDVTELEIQDKLKLTASRALQSLYDRVFENSYWRSGAGNWVSNWEATGLCLEAFYKSKERNDKYKDLIQQVITYLMTDNVFKQWLPENICFQREEDTNNVLASVVLASVVYQFLKEDLFNVKFKDKIKKIENFFITLIDIITKREEAIPQRQFCTIPQILSYITNAIMR